MAVDDFPLLVNNWQRLNEGWMISHDQKIQTISPSYKLSSNEAAVEFVKMRAEQGSEYHKEAIMCCVLGRLSK